MATTGRTRLEPGEHGYEIRGGEFQGKILTLGSTDSMDVIVGDAQFTDCEFRMKHVAKIDFNFDATCVRCDFHLPKRVSNRWMDRPVLENCRFHGHFVGFDFGPKFLDKGVLGPSTGRLRNCDFTDARLHLCAFYSTTLAEHSWPDWPHVYLDYSEGADWAHRLGDSVVPERMQIILRLQPKDAVEETSVRSRCIIALYLPEFEQDPEGLWPLIQDVPQIWFPGKSRKPRASPDHVLAVRTQQRQAAERLTHDRDRLAPFNLMYRCWLLECKDAETFQGIELVFDSSYLQSKVPEAPAKVRLVLKEGKASLRKSSGSEPVMGSVDKFLVTSALLEGQTAVLKPHRKERGQFVVDFSECELLDPLGARMEVSRLRDYVQRYWAT